MKTLITATLFMMSLATFAKTEIKEGIIRQVTCNSPSGLGYIYLEYKVKKRILNMEAIKVNSYKLCGNKPDAQRIFKGSILADIGFNALFLGDTYWFKLEVKNGFITKILDQEKVDYTKYMKKVRNIKRIKAIEASNWFFAGPTRIFWTTEERINEMVKEFTSKEFVSKFY